MTIILLPDTNLQLLAAFISGLGPGFIGAPVRTIDFLGSLFPAPEKILFHLIYSRRSLNKLRLSHLLTKKSEISQMLTS